MWLKSAEETTLPLRIFFYIERIMDPSVAAVSGAMIVFSIVLVIVTEKVVGLSRTMNV
jgi:putative spermidine/putrescine transport system permease protein